MAGSVFDIQPGPARSYGPLAKGSTIVNNDTVNSVWVSSSLAVSPGNGLELKPAGSVVWQAEQTTKFTTNPQPAILYACVGMNTTTGATVTVPVSITTSDDVDQVQDPLGVALATAAQLLVTGIPSVFLIESVPLFPSGVLTQGQFSDIEVSKYASFQLQWICSGDSLLQVDSWPSDNVGVGIPMTEFYGNHDSNTSGNVVIPVRAGKVRITSLLATSVTVLVYGSNREIDQPSNMGLSTLTRSFSRTGAVVSGVPIAMPAVDGFPSSTCLNRQCTVRQGMTTSGYFYYEELTPAGITQIAFTQQPAGTVAYSDMGHPISTIKWFFMPAASGTATATLWIAQE